MNTVRYGIVGFGGIAENRIAKEGFGLDTDRFEEDEAFRLVAACDRNSARKEAAVALGLHWYDDLDVMLSEEPLDAVVIATNNRTHAHLAIKALIAGKHVFIEKPAGTTLEAVSQLLLLAEEKGLSVGVDHMMTKNVLNIQARDLVRNREIGDVEHIVLHMEFPYGLTPEEAATWRCSDPGEFGGPIGDVGSHCFYMAEFLLDDKVTSLQCRYTPKHLDIVVEDGAVIYAETLKGIPVTIRVAFDQKRGTLHETISNLGFEIYGTEGSIVAKGSLFQFSGHDDEPITMDLSTVKHGKEVHMEAGEIRNIYAEQIAEHANSILAGDPLSGKAALHNLELIHLCHLSAKEGGKRLEQGSLLED